METMPRKFFGIPVGSIKTAEDCIEALDYFIRNASDEEVVEACNELEQLPQATRSVIRSLLWKVPEYGLDSPEWMRAFELKYASA